MPGSDNPCALLLCAGLAARANHRLDLDEVELPENHPWATRKPVSARRRVQHENGADVFAARAGSLGLSLPRTAAGTTLPHERLSHTACVACFVALTCHQVTAEQEAAIQARLQVRPRRAGGPGDGRSGARTRQLGRE